MQWSNFTFPSKTVGYKMNRGVQIILIDDHDMVRQGLRALLGSVPEFHFCADFASGKLALEQLDDVSAHLALIDINMPEMNGLEVAAIIRKRRPEIKIVMVSMEIKQSYVRRAYELGLEGYISKSADISELVRAIKDVVNDNRVFPLRVNS